MIYYQTMPGKKVTEALVIVDPRHSADFENALLEEGFTHITFPRTIDELGLTMPGGQSPIRAVFLDGLEPDIVTGGWGLRRLIGQLLISSPQSHVAVLTEPNGDGTFIRSGLMAHAYYELTPNQIGLAAHSARLAIERNLA